MPDPRLSAILPCPLPDASLLSRYRLQQGAYTDCYSTEIDGGVSQAEFVEAFYTTWVFKLERTILKWAVARPSTDAQAALLAQGGLDAFSAWTVEDRREDQLLLCDMHGRTRSWLMAAPAESGNGTRLYFGSAVVPPKDRNPAPISAPDSGFCWVPQDVFENSAGGRRQAFAGP